MNGGRIPGPGIPRMRSEDMDLSDNSSTTVGSRGYMARLRNSAKKGGTVQMTNLASSVGNPSYAEQDHPWSERPRERAREVAHEARRKARHARKAGVLSAFPRAILCFHWQHLSHPSNGWNSVLNYLLGPMVGDGKCLTSLTHYLGNAIELKSPYKADREASGF